MAAIIDSHHKAQVLKILSLCALWYFSSSIGNVIAKKLLSEFPYPVTLTMVQHICLIVNLAPLLRWWNVRRVEPGSISNRYYWTVIIPVAAGKFLSNASAAFSIWKVPLSYAHTVKATMPLWTVCLSRIILGEKQTPLVHLSLVPIIVGVFISTVTEVSFQFSGLISALAATAGFSLQNIYTKKTMKDTGIHPLRLLQLLAQISAACFFPLWILTDVYRVINDEKITTEPGHLMKCALLLTADGYLAFVQHVVAFSLISLIAPLSYAVANATKRITIITASILILKNSVTLANVSGMLMALTGVFAYNYAKLQQRKWSGTPGVGPGSLVVSPSEAILPYVRTQANLMIPNGRANGNTSSSILPTSLQPPPASSPETSLLGNSRVRKVFDDGNRVVFGLGPAGAVPGVPGGANPPSPPQPHHTPPSRSLHSRYNGHPVYEV